MDVKITETSQEQSDQTGQRDVYIAQDSGNMAEWGVLQYYDTLQEGENGQTKEAGYIRINIKSVCSVPETAHVSVFFQQSYLQNKL